VREALIEPFRALVGPPFKGDDAGDHVFKRRERRLDRPDPIGGRVVPKGEQHDVSDALRTAPGASVAGIWQYLPDFLPFVHVVHVRRID
jgi:hypothetical protein